MKISLQWINDYVDLSDIAPEELAHELTMRTVEVEDIRYQELAYDKVVVGKIMEILPHPQADKLLITIVDVGEAEPYRIVCGGCNLYEGQRVVVALPGSYVRWHGQGEPVLIKKTKLRGEPSCGMICASEELELDELFPASREAEIMDLKDFDFPAGMPISEALQLNDVILEIDNKSLTNRPDLWGHYGIARELSVIFQRNLMPVADFVLDSSLEDNEHSLPVTIESPKRCSRYAGLVFSGLDSRPAPHWMRVRLAAAGITPHNALIDITNYVMMTTGCPTHGFDRRFVNKELIIREARKGETLELLDDTFLQLTAEDLVICDTSEPMALAGVKGGKKDSLHDDTTEMVLEVAVFDPLSIRHTAQRFNVRTEASTRYEKGIDTQRVDISIALACQLLVQLFPEAQLLGYQDAVATTTSQAKIDVSLAALSKSLGRKVDYKQVSTLLFALGFTVQRVDEDILNVVAPSWRSTGDVSLFCDIVEEVARIIGYENFDFIPPTVTLEKAIKQDGFDLERRVREYLAFRCDFREIFTYPWTADDLIAAAGVEAEIELAQPPAPDQSRLRPSLVPGLIGNVRGNLRFQDEIKVFEMAQIFLSGETSPSDPAEIFPVQKLNLAGAIAADEDQGLYIFREVKGLIAQLPDYAGSEQLTFQNISPPVWADKDVWLNIIGQGESIGSLGLLSSKVKNAVGIKRTQVAVFELDMTKLTPQPTRGHEYRPLPHYPLVEEDFAMIVEEKVTWEQVREIVEPMVKELTYVEEYRGSQIPAGKKSLLFHVLLGSDEGTLSSDQIAGKRGAIVKQLSKKLGAELRQ
ncbi:MAG TPA: phenylalanine--tRNA ligase subunit beta [Clostridiaceae bacterium]|nr:phenylalanine--tRNA ligase subunit beta [Clostridiaceae bacterium]